jgi:hypothetical protein
MNALPRRPRAACPCDVHYDRTADIVAARQRVLDEAHRRPGALRERVRPIERPQVRAAGGQRPA